MSQYDKRNVTDLNKSQSRLDCKSQSASGLRLIPIENDQLKAQSSQKAIKSEIHPHLHNVVRGQKLTHPYESCLAKA